MNNRNQQTGRAQAPAESPAPTYLNVFTVEEYERAARPPRSGPRSEQHSLTRKYSASQSNSRPFQSMADSCVATGR
jgi:hypothetical protein